MLYLYLKFYYTDISKMSELRNITRKLSAKESALIVKQANEKYNAKETKLSDRIEAWCVANFNPEMENLVRSAFDEILDAATPEVRVIHLV